MNQRTGQYATRCVAVLGFNRHSSSLCFHQREISVHLAETRFRCKDVAAEPHRFDEVDSPLNTGKAADSSVYDELACVFLANETTHWLPDIRNWTFVHGWNKL
ncbi:MAG: hypothetical protein ABJZ55_14825 [Fuerstiella sp.]